MLTISSRLGPYQIDALLGAGGMGEVYRAHDTRLGRDVAVKVLPEPYANNPDWLVRFEREARAVAALSHPNILAIHDYGKHESISYAVMELLVGETLGHRLLRGSLPWEDAIKIGTAVAEGLGAAHAKGIIHRDLKPENLFLTNDGRVKILDFGLARIEAVFDPQSDTIPYVPSETESGRVMGTVGYMSPEQVRGQTADARSDLFSFGCVLYEMLTGQRAFLRETAVETMTAILHDDPPDHSKLDSSPPDMEKLIRQCLAKDPKHRPQSARDLLTFLRAAAANPIQENPARRSPPDKSEPEVIQAVAVLPFDNVGGDPKVEYLSDGLADHLIISISQVRRRGLKVRPFSSVVRYKRQPIDIPSIGKQLKVQVVVTGTLHQQGDDIWISVALVDAQEDNHLWGKRYQGQRNGILDLQDEIARDVAANLRLRLTGEEDQRLTKRYTEDPDAYLLYTEAMSHWNKFTEEGMVTGIGLCTKALLHDPNYALAYVGLAQCYVLLGNLYLGPRKTFAEARRCAERALEIDDTLEGGHTFLGAIYLFHDWNWSAAESELKRGTGLNAHPASLTLYGFCLAALGRLHEALDTLRRGQELDPTRAAHRNEVAMVHNMLRQYDLALGEAQKAFELDASFPLAHAELGIALVKLGRYDDAISHLTQAIERGQKHPSVRGTLGYALATAGNRQEALTVAQELSAVALGRFGFALPISRIYAALDDADQAIKWLKKACDERTPFVIWLKFDSTFDTLHNDSRFQKLLQEMGIPG